MCSDPNWIANISFWVVLGAVCLFLLIPVVFEVGLEWGKRKAYKEMEDQDKYSSAEYIRESVTEAFAGIPVNYPPAKILPFERKKLLPPKV